MKISLSQNISKLRKENGMTQEQLAEALGVTFAAVSKWERGAATPELDTIVQLADLFCISVDALLGYRMRSNDLHSIVERLKEYSHEHVKNDDALLEAEKALKRFPNQFDVVYRSALLYSVRGLNESNKAFTRRALELFKHACCLIDQNTDDEISETSIYQRMAMDYMAIDENDKGLELWKKHNPCGVNDALIGEHLAAQCNRPDEALPYLSEAMVDLTASQMRITMGYMNYFEKKKNFAEADALLEWSLAFYPKLKRDGVISYLEKSEAALWGLRAGVQMEMQQEEKAAECLREARKVALRFDSAPNYDANSIRFVHCSRQATFHDSIGNTAMLGIDAVIKDIEIARLAKLWEEIKHEEK